MTMTLSRVLCAVVLAGGVLAAGCDADGDGYDDTTGRPVPVHQPAASPPGAESGSGCDPAGWGPLSGCDHDTADPAGSRGPGMRVIPTPGDLEGEAVIVPASCPDYRWAQFDYNTGAVIATGVPVSAECAAALEAEAAEQDAAFATLAGHAGGEPR